MAAEIDNHVLRPYLEPPARPVGAQPAREPADAGAIVICCDPCIIEVRRYRIARRVRMDIGDRGHQVPNDAVGRKPINHLFLFVSEQRREQAQIGKIEVIAPCIQHHYGTFIVNTRLELERRFGPGSRCTADLKIIHGREPAVRISPILETAGH